MTQALVAANVHLALDVLGHLPPEITFDLELLVDEGSDSRDLVVGEVANPGCGVDAGGLADVQRGSAADAVDIGQRDQHPLLTRDVAAGDTCHWILPLALALLVAGVAADDLNATVTPDHPALVTDALNARSDLHVLSLLLFVAATGNDYL